MSTDPFIRCTLPCSFCGTAIAQTHTMQRSVPRQQLITMGRANGAVQSAAGEWFCNPACRLNYRLEHGVHHIEMPELDEATKSG